MTPQLPDETRSSVATSAASGSLHTAASELVGSGSWFRLADEVNWPLNGQCMPLFLPLDHNRGANHLSGRGDVDQEGFSGSWRHQDRRIREKRLQVLEGFLGLGGPSEALGLP